MPIRRRGGRRGPTGRLSAPATRACAPGEMPAQSLLASARMLLGAVAVVALLGVEAHDAVSDELPRVDVDVLLVLVRPGLDPALNEDLGALVETLGEAFALLAPEDAAKPRGLFLPLVVLLPRAADRDAELQDRLAARCVPKLGVAPDVALNDRELVAGHQTNSSVSMTT
jgi:hypothetical protein